MPTTIAEFKQAFSTTAARPDSALAEYKAARRTALESYDDCFVQARSFDALKKARDGLSTRRREMEDAAKRGEYPAAQQEAEQLAHFVADYLKRADAIQKNYDDLGKQIIKEIDAASWCQEDDVARRWIDELSDAQLNFLPARVRNRLLEELREGAFCGDEKEATRKVYRCSRLDPAFEKKEKRLYQRYLEYLNHNPMITKARKNWNELDTAQKLKVLKRVADLHATAYATTSVPGSEPLSIEPYDERPEVDSSGKPTPKSYAEYSHFAGTIRFNVHEGLGLESFHEALDWITHEAQHRYQHVLVDRLDDGTLQPGDDEYEQAVTFKLNRDYYIDDWEDGYFFQPLERHAHAVGDRIRGAGIGFP